MFIRSRYVYYGIRGICFQQPPSRSLDHPINLLFPIVLGWKGWTGVIKHIWIYMLKNALTYINQKMFLIQKIQAKKNRVVGFQPIWTTVLIKLDHPPQVCRDWFFLMFETTTNSTARHITGSFLSHLGCFTRSLHLYMVLHWRPICVEDSVIFWVCFKVPFQFQNLNKTSQINIGICIFEWLKKNPHLLFAEGIFRLFLSQGHQQVPEHALVGLRWWLGRQAKCK